MELSLFDLHCDTAYEMLKQGQPLEANTLAVSLEHAKAFQRYIQVMALWTDYALDDETGWERCLAMMDHLRRDPAIFRRHALLVNAPDRAPDRPTLLLGLEDARILGGKVERVDTLYEAGVRILTPLWKGCTCIGGSHDTDLGLTPFGKNAIRQAVSRGMIADISHASIASANEIFEIAESLCRPVIASHSNAWSVCRVSRNLRDEQIGKILHSGGVIGLNLHKPFIAEPDTAEAKDLLPHIDHFLSLGAEDALCLGGDMDGCDLPPDIQNLSELPKLAELLLQQNISETLIHKIFYENAARFAAQFLKA